MGGYVDQSRIVPGFEPGRPENVCMARQHSTYPWNYADEFKSNAIFGTPTQNTYSYRDSVLGSVPSQEQGHTWAARVQELASSDSARRSSQFDTGHPFNTHRTGFSCSKVKLYDSTGGLCFSGRMSPHATWPISPDGKNRYDFPASFPTDQASLETLGTRAISDVWPTNPPAALAQSLIELYREGLPALVGLQALRARGRRIPAAAAGEHLNYQFGWKPLVNDVRAAARAAAMSSEILQQYQEESGEILHRQRYFPEDVITHRYVSTSPLGVSTALPNQRPDVWFNPRTALITETLELYQKVWFHGAFTYYLQGDNLTLNKLHEIADRARVVYGVEFNLNTLWQVTPWTWLLDWVGNIGDNITNATRLAEDGMILRYGYVMRTTSAKRTREQLFTRRYGGGTVPIHATWTSVRKERVRATPFGFGLNPDTFSGRQWSILAALGMTRGNRSLRMSD